MAVVYSSGLHIQDQGELCSLAVAYDKVYLPASTPETASEGVIFRKESETSTRLKLVITAIRGWTFEDKATGQTVEAEAFIEAWNTENKVLYEEGVLERLSPPPKGDHAHTMSLVGSYLDELTSPILRMPYLVQNEEHLYLWQDQLDHLLRTDIEVPRIFTSRESAFSRELMKALVTLPAFSYTIPALASMPPDRLLEVRRRTASNREGFNFFVQQLTADVEDRIQSGDTIDEVAKYAASVVETRVVPQYGEFVRQLTADRAGFWNGVLDSTGKLFEIDAAPWTPKFWGDLLKAFGFTILGDAERKKSELSNRVQAFKFLNSAERATRK